jgi:hypothetical protein
MATWRKMAGLGGKTNWKKIAGISSKDLGLPKIGKRRGGLKLGSGAYFKKLLRDV